MNSDLTKYIDERLNEFDQIDQSRKDELMKIAKYVSDKKPGTEVYLIFICTHNSRRSYMSQIWAQISAHKYGLNHIKTFSGGTEATAFNPRAVKSLQKPGIEIEKQEDSPNPKYLVSYAKQADKIIAFSNVNSKNR